MAKELFTKQPKSGATKKMTAQHSSDITQKLLALKIRLNHAPLMYRRADELDWPEHQRSWYTTNFAHEQMMGNLQNSIEIIDELLRLVTPEK